MIDKCSDIETLYAVKQFLCFLKFKSIILFKMKHKIEIEVMRKLTFLLRKILFVAEESRIEIEQGFG